MIIIICIAVVVFIGLVLYFAASSTPRIKTNNEIEQAKRYYEATLNGNDRKAALIAGRFYYSLGNSKRTLTMQDELMIANDLSTMPVQTYT